MQKEIEYIKSQIRTIPNFPKPGIMFRDITTLLKDGKGLKNVIKIFAKRHSKNKIEQIVGIEARGFILGSALAYELGIGFVPIRKKGKLPGKTISKSYQLEYGIDSIEIHDDALISGDKILLVDDLIATGGTAIAAVELLMQIGANIQEALFVVDLPELKGKKRLLDHGIKVFNILEFDGE